jgi:hypothetical protein
LEALRHPKIMARTAPFDGQGLKPESFCVLNAALKRRCSTEHGLAVGVELAGR